MSQSLASFVLVVLVVVFCVTSASSQTTAAIKVQAGGSTLSALAFELWSAAYLSVDNAAQFVYNNVGSTAGVAALAAGTFSFVGTEAPTFVTAVPQNDGMLLPIVAGAIVPVVNVPYNGTGTLTLNGDVLAKIYLGAISSWNDPAIAALNPTLSLPSIPITLVVRSDGAGSSYIFTTALSSFNSQWPASAVGSKPTWPAPVIRQYESAGVAIYVRENVGAIGYTGVSYATQFSVPYAQMINAAGAIVNATNSAVLAAMQDFHSSFDTSFVTNIVNAPSAASWPIAGYTYILLKRTTLSDPSIALDIALFLRWATTDANAMQLALDTGFVPIVTLGDDITARVWQTINQIQSNGVIVTQQIFPYQYVYYAFAALLLIGQSILMILVLVHRNMPYMRATNTYAQLMSQFGVLVLLASVFAWDSLSQTPTCNLRIWMTTLGSTLFLGRMWAKAARPWQFLPGYSISTPVADHMIMIATACLFAIDIIVCIVWTSAGQVHGNDLYECATLSFWGYFGFLLVYKTVIVVWTMFSALNTPPSLSYFGETIYIVQAGAAVIVLCALFLPVIFLVPQTPTNQIRMFFSPSVLIMLCIILANVYMLSHRLLLRRAIDRARAGLMHSSNSSHTSSIASLPEHGGETIATGVAATVVVKSDPENGISIEFTDAGHALSMTSLVTSNTNSDEFSNTNGGGEKERDFSSPIQLSSTRKAREPANVHSKKLDKLLNDPGARLLFRQMLMRLLCVEVLDFWLAIEEYKRCHVLETRIDFARSIYQVYISSGADDQINLTHPVRTALVNKLQTLGQQPRRKTSQEAAKIADENATPLPDLPDDLFSAAQQQAFDMMRGIYVLNFSDK